MKPIETISKFKHKYVLIMILCFLYGGFCLIMFLSQAYGFFWRTEINTPLEPQIISVDSNAFRPEFREDFNLFRVPRDPVALLTSPTSLSLLIGGIISILAGITIWKLTREKEIKKVKYDTTVKLLLPDEKQVIEALKESNNELTQAKIAKNTGLTKVQVHRAIKRLEAKGAIEKHDFGLTNKIILKKDFID